MRTLISMILSIIMLLFSCKEKKKPIAEDVKGIEVHDSIAKPPARQDTFKVSAHLIYEDGSTSDFDVLNNKTIALWNTIIGAGDALKPSNSTKINLTGNLDSLSIKIKNGKKIAVDTIIMHSNKDFEYIIKNTGCSLVYVNVTRNKKVIYNDTIPFHCGE